MKRVTNWHLGPEERRSQILTHELGSLAGHDENDSQEEQASLVECIRVGVNIPPAEESLPPEREVRATTLSLQSFT